MTLMLSTVGCSLGGSSSWISSDGTNIYVNGKQAMLTEFDGITGTYKVDGDPMQVKYTTCVEQIRDCPENRQGVHEADLSTYKKANYFDAYIDSFSCMHIPLEEGKTIEATMSTQDKEMKPLDSVRSNVYDTMSNLKFENIEQATFADCIEIRGNGNNLTVRNTDITIPGILSVMKGTKDCTQQVDIAGVTVMKYESNNFDFYQYGDNLIKSVKGTNIEDYVTLKLLKE